MFARHWFRILPSFALCLALTLGCSSAPAEGDDAPAETPEEVDQEVKKEDGQWAAVDTGDNHTCALADDQSLWCWGRNHRGELGHDGDDSPAPNPVGADVDWRSVATGGSHTCAIKDDDSLWCWGSNHRGQLGVDSEENYDAPMQVGADQNWQSVAAGGDFSCAIDGDRSLWCWGNYQNHSPFDDVEFPRSPEQLDSDTDWQSLSAGGSHGCAIADDDSLWCWGGNISGQLGLGDDEDRLQPEQIGEERWLSVSAGSSHTCAIDADKNLWCWGNGSRGQLGLGDEEGYDTPQQVGEGLWRAVAGGNHNTCAVDNEGDLACWGDASQGQLGIETPEDTLVPTFIDSENTWDSLATGRNHSCAVTDSGDLHCWGSQTYGQVGSGVHAGDKSEPVALDWADSLEALSAGAGFGCAIAVDGALVCWGSNSRGQLGLGDERDRHRPQQVGDETWRSVSASQEGREPFACAIRDDDTLWCWGANGHNQLGLGSPDDEDQASADPRRGRRGTNTERDEQRPQQVGEETWAVVATGATHSCAIRDDGTLWCWGAGPDGRLGLGDDVENSGEPTRVGEDDDWTSVTSGDFYTCAIRDDSSLWCWGQNTWGQLGDGTNDQASTPQPVAGERQWKSVEAGQKTTCAIADDATLWCWGEDENGQLGIGEQDYHRDPQTDEDDDGRRAQRVSPGEYPNEPTQVGEASDWELIAAGRDHICGIRQDQSLWCWGSNARGQLAQDDDGDIRTPQQVDAASDWIALSAAPAWTAALRADQSGWTWGWSSDGQLGDGTAWTSEPLRIPVPGDSAI